MTLEFQMDPKFVVADDGSENPDHRTTPVHKIKHVYARGGMVIIVGMVGDKEVEIPLTRKVALERAEVIGDAARKAVHRSDADELLHIYETFLIAINDAKRQDGGKYKSTRVSMHMSTMDPREPLGREVKKCNSLITP